MNQAATSTDRPPEATKSHGLDLKAIRTDFPALSLNVNGHPLTFLDSGASAQKPRAVLDRMTKAYESEYANVHRGTYYLSQLATDNYEETRRKVAGFINAKSEDEVVFTRNATASVNMVAQTYGRENFGPGDEVVISEMEHHANIVPWQMLRDQVGITLRVAPVDDDGEFLLDEFAALLSPRTKLVALTHVSNVLGTITPLAEIIRLAHEQDIPVLIDGAQGIVHSSVDVQALDVEFYVFTGHKLYGPTGIGVLYGKATLLEKMPPYQGGGDMIENVTFEKTTYREPPARFEAGTPPIVEAIGLGAAIDYVSAFGMDKIAAHEHGLLKYGTEQLLAVPGLKLIGTAKHKSGILSFTLEDIHPHDVATIIDAEGVAVRAGHHCAQPLMDRMGVTATTRASFGMYNTTEDVDALVRALGKVREIFG